MTKDGQSIVDASKPNAGRIYDYFLGGHHNFEVDRQVAERMLDMAPFISKAVRLNRWCLQDIAKELTVQRGFDTIIDFASGLPTQDHIHTAVPEGTTVIYSDYDPVVVEYALEILGDTPNVYFFQADARQPEELLDRPEMQGILDGKRRVGVVYWGVTLYISDEDVAHAARVLYDWTADGSCWAFGAQQAGANRDDPVARQVLETYESMGRKLHIRPLEEYKELIQPWQPDEEGFVPLLEWHGFDESFMSEEDRQTFGATGGSYGAYLVK